MSGYDKKDLKPQEFADDEWHREDDELFADPMDASEPVPELNTIPQNNYGTHPYSDESRTSSLLSDIPYSVGDEEHPEENNDTPEDQLRRETEEWSRLQLNKGDRDLGIQPPDAASKRSRQDLLADPTPGTRQSARLIDKTPTSANVMRSVSTTLSGPKSHVHMVTVLANFSTGCDDSGPDEPLQLKRLWQQPIGKTLRRPCMLSFNMFQLDWGLVWPVQA